MDGISAIQSGGKRIEYHKPDLSIAYAVLAPVVAEAATLAERGCYAEAWMMLKRAKEVVDEVAERFMVAQVEPEWDEGGSMSAETERELESPYDVPERAGKPLAPEWAIDRLSELRDAAMELRQRVRRGECDEEVAALLESLASRFDEAVVAVEMRFDFSREEQEK